MRIALVVEYDGSQYHGWQAQTGLRTVESAVVYALSKVADHPVSVVCAGRTDTGVHATHQVIHFDADKTRSIRGWMHGANSFLPKDVCVKWVREMPDHFHARFSAQTRQYRYVIYNAPIRPGLLRCNVTWQYHQLNHHSMDKAAQSLVGEHDFTSFRAVECQSKTPIRRVHSIRVSRQENFVIMDITANAFLHHMVRNIAGVLMAIGTGRQPIGWIDEVLLAKDRRLGAETAPPYGLYLVGVSYPEEFSMISPNFGPLFFGSAYE